MLPPLMRMDFAPLVVTFLDLAEASGVRHVTYLSEYGTRQFPPDSAPRAVERDLTGRGNITHSILRPAWFTQNFSEGFLYPVQGCPFTGVENPGLSGRGRDGGQRGR